MPEKDCKFYDVCHNRKSSNGASCPPEPEGVEECEEFWEMRQKQGLWDPKTGYTEKYYKLK